MASADISGLARAVMKQNDLTIPEYQGLARDGELVVDTNPGTGQYTIWIGRLDGTLIPASTGGGGNVAFANNANLANTANFAVNVTGPNQPNITSLGNLTSLTVVGNSNLGSNSNVKITGGTPGQVLTTDGFGNLSWTTAGTGTQIVNGLSNVSIPVPNGNVNISVGGVANVLQATATGINVNGNSNLGSNANVRITGGTSGQVLTTNGSGVLSWSSVVTAQPAIEWISTAPFGQYINFTHPNLAVFGSNSLNATLTKNGSVLDAVEYTITGTTLTVNSWVATGDSIRILAR